MGRAQMIKGNSDGPLPGSRVRVLRQRGGVQRTQEVGAHP